HALKAPPHALTLEEWAELQRLLDPEEHDDKPPPAAPSLVLERPARVAVMGTRRRERVGLFHPDDLWHDEEEGERARLRLVAPHTRSGRCEEEEYVAPDRRAA